MKLCTILCCLNPTCPAETIDEFTFYRMVNPVTQVINIKIFDRASQVKAFVQVSDEGAADIVIKELHGKQMNIGRIKVYTSHKKFISFDKPLPMILAMANRSSMEYDHGEQSSRKKPSLIGNPYLSNSGSSFKNTVPSYSSWKKSNTQNKIVNYLDKTLYSKTIEINYEKSQSIYVTKKHMYHTNPVLDDEDDDVPKSKLVAKQSTMVEQTKFVKMSNLNAKAVNVQMLLNLFGCFGNVYRLVLTDNLEHAIAEYETEAQAATALKYTDCIRFCDKILSVTIYSGPEVFDDKNSIDGQQFTIYTKETTDYTFSNYSNLKFTPPSRMLALSGLPENANKDIVKDILGANARPLNIMDAKSQNDKTKSFWIEFNFLYESIKILSLINHMEYEGVTLHASFINKNDAL